MRRLLNDKLAYAAQLGMVIALLVSVLVGVLVYYKVTSGTDLSLGTPTSEADAVQKAAANTARNSTMTSSGTVFTLAPIMAIVLIAGIILAIVTKFGTSGQ